MNSEFRGVEAFEPSSSAKIDLLIFEQIDDLKEKYSSFARKPLSKNSEPLEEAATDHLESVQYVLNYLDDGTTSEENIDNLVKYAKGLETNRVKELKKIDSSNEDAYKVGNIYDKIKDAYINIDDLDDNEREFLTNRTVAEVVFIHYEEMFRIDMNIFSQSSVENYKEKPSTKRREKFIKIGRHAAIASADIAKIGMGIAAGIIIAKKFHR